MRSLQPAIPWDAGLLIGAGLLIILIGVLTYTLALRKRGMAHYIRILQQAHRAESLGRYEEALRRCEGLVAALGQLASPTHECLVLRARAQLRMGEIERLRGHESEAVQHYEQALGLAEFPREAIELLAAERAQRRDVSAQAVRIYIQYLSELGNSRAANAQVVDLLRVRLESATVTRNEDKLRAAEATLQSIASALQGEAWVYHCLGQIERRLDRPTQAVGAFTRAAKLEPQRASTWLALASLHMSQNHDEAALEAFRAVLPLAPKRPEPHIQIARILLRLREPDGKATPGSLAEVHQHLQAAADIGAIDAGLWILLSQSNEALGRPGEAIEAARYAYDAAPTDPRYFTALIRLHTARGDHSEARRIAVEATQKHPKFATAFACAGRLALDENDPGAAEGFFRKALELTANDQGCSSGLGLALYWQGKWAEAAVALGRLREHTAETRLALGRAYAHNKQLEQARQALELVLREQPQDSAGWFDLGIVCGKLGHWNRAEEAFVTCNTCAREEPIRARALFYIGVARSRQQRRQDAQAAYNAALTVCPSDPAIHYALGLTACEDGNFDYAQRHFADAAQVGNSYTPAWLGRATILEQQGLYDEAISAYNVALSLEPRNLSGRARLAVTLAKARRWQEAQTAFQALDVSQLDAQSQSWAALACWEAEQRADSLAIWERLGSLRPDDPSVQHNLIAALCGLADERFDAGAYDDALTLWQRAQGLGWRAAGPHIAEAAIRAAEQRQRSMALMGIQDPMVPHLLAVAAAAAPQDERLLHAWGLLFLQAGDVFRALDKLRTAAEARPENGRYSYDLAIANLAAGDGLAAAESLSRVSAAEAKSLPAFQVVRGWAEAIQGHQCEAFGAYQSALLGETWPTLSQSPAEREPFLTAVAGQMVACGRATGRLADALSTFESLERVPQAPSCMPFYLAVLLADTGDLDAAIDKAREYQAASGDNQATLLLGSLLAKQAAAQIRRSELVTATSTLMKVAQLTPKPPVIDEALASLSGWQAIAAMQTGDFERAIRSLERKLENEPTSLWVIHWLAILYYRMASAPPVDSISTGYPAVPPTSNAEQWWQKVVAFWCTVFNSSTYWSEWSRKRKFEAGLEIGHSALAHAKDAAQHRLLADIRDLGARASATRPDTNSARLSEIEILWGIESEASELLEECLSDYGLDGWMDGLRCGPLMLNVLERIPSAKPQVEALRRALPTFAGENGRRLARYHSPLGDGYYLLDANRYEQAIEVLQQYDKNPQIRLQLAAAYLVVAREAAEASDWAKVVNSYEQAESYGADLRPSAIQVADAAVARVKQMRGSEAWDIHSATALLHRAEKLAANHAELRRALCQCYTEQASEALSNEEPQRSLRLIGEALRYDSQNVEARTVASGASFSVGLEWLRKNNADAAVSAFRQCLAYRDNGDAREAIRDVLFQCELWLPLIEFLTPWLQENPDDESLRHNLFAAYHNIGLNYAQAGMWDEAIQFLGQGLKVEADADSRKALAECYAARAHVKYRSGNVRGAKIDLNTAIRLDGSNWEWRQALNAMTYG